MKGEILEKDLNMKIEILDFNGGMKGKGFLEWLEKVEIIFSYKEIPNPKRVKLVAMKLSISEPTW